MQKEKKIKLVLEDGKEFTGFSFGRKKSVSGEVVFNTAMTGYPESLTDPSYKGQILVLTYPIVGNYGVPGDLLENDMYKYFESYSLHITGLIISDYTDDYSHWNANKSLGKWLEEFNVPGIYGIDTRLLTKILREEGTMTGKIIYDDQQVDFYDPNQENLVEKVSTREKKVFGTGRHRILLIDCGVKYNIIRNLLKRDTTVAVVPYDCDIKKEQYDGLFISNGPGDPKKCEPTIKSLRTAIDHDIPIYGICLGNQLLALAAGADTYKLKYGHRSHNQPVILNQSNKSFITSQNHGYAIDNLTLPGDWEPWFINLNDNTNEGMRHKSKPFFSTQFHPEASGGPTDTEFLFDLFIENIKQHKNESDSPNAKPLKVP
ncbi:MAG: glutamine-hydrolyzing carbamoyl-phosphate synthase small subunit [Bacteroidales bacterium]|nr:glutamine-hydrolyzing carbamoyl-phosphate synthase small subunit [Bacteroidales bacterium]